MSSRLIIFAKNPIIGKTKTRISRKLGDEVALAIYYRLINKAQRITSDLPFDKVVYYSEFVDTEDSWDNSIYDKRQQVDRDLGARMDLAIREQFDEGFDKVVLIGTDIYELTSSIIKQAFMALDNSDVVLGPAKDGGYYLIGMKNADSSIFDITAWSTHSVFDETLKNIKRTYRTYTLLPELNDIDEPEDLEGTDLLTF